MKDETPTTCGSDLSTELGELPEPTLFSPQMITEDAYTARQMREYAADQVLAAVAAERERWEEVVFDGWRVLQGFDERARKRTSHQNVSDTLDALVRVMKPNATDEPPEGSASITELG